MERPHAVRELPHPLATRRLRVFGAQPSIDEKLVRELAAGAYLADATNVLFIGPPGVGKTMLAVILGRAAVDAGHRDSSTPPQPTWQPAAAKPPSKAAGPQP